MLNLHFKDPQALGPFRIDRACKKIPTCKIWWVFVQYTSSYGQNTSPFLFICCYFLYFEVFPPFTPQIPLPTIVKSFQDILFDHKNDIEHILYGYISRKHEFRRRTFSNFLWTRNWGKPKVYNSQYLACLPIFIPYIHTICILHNIINPTKTHLSTIYSISRHPFSAKKIVAHWRHNKS